MNYTSASIRDSGLRFGDGLCDGDLLIGICCLMGSYLEYVSVVVEREDEMKIG